MNKEFIFNTIKESGFTFWKLLLVTGYNNTVHLRTYNVPDSTPESAIRALDNIIEELSKTNSNRLKFLIEIKSSEKANGSGVIGPLEFMINEPTTSGGLSGVSMPQNFTELGYVPQSVLSAEKELFNEKLNINNQLLEARFNQRLLDEDRKRLAEKEAIFNSGANKIATALGLLVENLAPKFLGQNNNLQGVKPLEPEPEPKDDKYKIIEKFAEFLYNKDITISELNQLIDYNKQLFNKKDHVSEQSENQ